MNFKNLDFINIEDKPNDFLLLNPVIVEVPEVHKFPTEYLKSNILELITELEHDIKLISNEVIQNSEQITQI